MRGAGPADARHDGREHSTVVRNRHAGQSTAACAALRDRWVAAGLCASDRVVRAVDLPIRPGFFRSEFDVHESGSVWSAVARVAALHGCFRIHLDGCEIVLALATGDGGWSGSGDSPPWSGAVSAD